MRSKLLCSVILLGLIFLMIGCTRQDAENTERVQAIEVNENIEMQNEEYPLDIRIDSNYNKLDSFVKSTNFVVTKSMLIHEIGKPKESIMINDYEVFIYEISNSDDDKKFYIFNRTNESLLFSWNMRSTLSEELILNMNKGDSYDLVYNLDRYAVLEKMDEIAFSHHITIEGSVFTIAYEIDEKEKWMIESIKVEDDVAKELSEVIRIYYTSLK